MSSTRFGFKCSLERHIEKIHVQGKRPRKVAKPYAMSNSSSSTQIITSIHAANDTNNINTHVTNNNSSSNNNEEYLLYKRGMKDIRNFDNIDLLPIFPESENMINDDEFSHQMDHEQDIWNSLLGLTY